MLGTFAGSATVHHRLMRHAVVQRLIAESRHCGNRGAKLHRISRLDAVRFHLADEPLKGSTLTVFATLKIDSATQTPSFFHVKSKVACGMTDAPGNVVVAGFTEDQAHRLTKVSLRQLRYWAADGFFQPSLDMASRGFPSLRLYSFRDLVCLRVVSSLRNESKVPLQHLRDVKVKLSHLGDDLWAKTTLHVLNRRVVIRNPETGEPEDAVTGQGVLQIPLAIVSHEMREAIRALRLRPEDTRGRIDTKTRGAKNPVIFGTRIPIRSIKDFAESGFTVAQIAEQYPSLTEADIQAALAYKLAA